MSQLFDSRAKVLEYEAKQRLIEKEIELAKLQAQPRKPWVGLTDEERDYIWNTVGNSDAHGDVDGWSGRNVMKAIETKLKENNA